MDTTTKQPDKNPEQGMFDVLMVQIRNMIYNEHGMPAVLDQIKGAEGGPQRGIGYTAAMLMKSVKGGLEKKGQTASPAALMGAYAETVADLTEVAVAANVIPDEQKAEVAKSALAEGAQIFKASNQKKPQPEQAPPAQAPAGPGLIKQAAGA